MTSPIQIRKLVDCWEIDMHGNHESSTPEFLGRGLFRLYDSFLGDSTGFHTTEEWQQHNAKYPKGYHAPSLSQLTYVIDAVARARIDERSRDEARPVAEFLEQVLVQEPIGTVSIIHYFEHAKELRIKHSEGEGPMSLEAYPIGRELLSLPKKELDMPKFAQSLFNMPIEMAVMAYNRLFESRVFLGGYAKKELYRIPSGIQLKLDRHNKTISIDASIAPETAYRTIGLQF